MEEFSLSFWDILLLPLALPLRSTLIALSYLQDEVTKANDPEAGRWDELLELEVLKEIGQIGEAEYRREYSRLAAQFPGYSANLGEGSPVSDDE